MEICKGELCKELVKHSRHWCPENCFKCKRYGHKSEVCLMSFQRPFSLCTHISAINTRVESFVKIITREKGFEKFSGEIEQERSKIMNMSLRTVLARDYHNILYETEDKINTLFFDFFKKRWGDDLSRVIKEWEKKVENVAIRLGYGHQVDGLYQSVVSEEDYVKLQHSKIEEAAIMYKGSKYILKEELIQERRNGN